MKKIICLALSFFCAVVFAQNAPKEVSLVVSADGATKTEAINNALRSAIEQTFGTFVSANTEILNDQLVKEEIATVSSGNIQKYTEVTTITLPNGNVSVTLNVTVSLSKLVSYAQSKGSECEFAGATFGANMRLYQFNKKNEQIAIQNMVKQLDALRPAFDYELEISDPVLNSDERTATIKLRVIAKANETTKMFNDIIKNTFMSLAMTREQINPLLNAGFKFEKYKLLIDNNISEIYLYGVIPDSLSLFVPSALLDYSIVDDAGGRYTITFSYCSNNNNTFGFILATSERISGYCWAPMWADCFYNETNWHNKTIVVNGELIVSKTPQIDFQVPIEQIGKITKIQIQPATFKKTNKIEDIHTFRYNWFYPSYIID